MTTSSEYTFSIFLFEDTGGGREGDLMGYQRLDRRRNIPTFICEFTPGKLEEMNKPVILKVVDNTNYVAGMNRLCLDVTMRSAWNVDTKRMMFDYSRHVNVFIDKRERVRKISLSSFRSIIVEFSELCMDQRLI